LVPLPVAGGSKHKSLFRLPNGADHRLVRPAALFIPRFTAQASIEPIAPAIATELLWAANRLTLELNDYYWYTAALDLLSPAAGHAARTPDALARLTAATPCYALGIDRSAGVDAVVERVMAGVGWSAPVNERIPLMNERVESTSSHTVPRAAAIRWFTGDELFPDEAAQRQLAEVAALPGVDEYVVVLPDVHFTRRNQTPTGTVVVRRSHIVPRAIDPGINCGMRMIATSVPAKELSPQRLDQLFGGLIERIPIEPRSEPVLSAGKCEQLLVEGLAAVAGDIGLTREELGRLENRGRITPPVSPDAIRSVVTASAVNKGQPWLGTLGAGNHFLELQEIVSVLD